MHADIRTLRDFYACPLGHLVRRLISRKVRSRWRNTKGETVFGLGFAAPFLEVFRDEPRRLGALMPTEQGALVWPRRGPVKSILVDTERLPLPDNSVDRLLAVHALENADRIRRELREMWRVLAPEGHLMIVVPNRRGVWARTDATPFGQGRPFSKRQLTELLQQALFTPVYWDTALYVPPVKLNVVVRYGVAIERAGARLTPAFAGVLIVEAKKELTAPVGKAVPARVVREAEIAATARPAMTPTRRDGPNSS